MRRVAADEARILHTVQFMEQFLASERTFVLPAQVMAELRHVLCIKLVLSGDVANQRLERWFDAAEIIATDAKVLEGAFSLAAKHGIQTYDAIILSAAAQAGCDTLYSEDMQHGFVWRRVEVVNPFIEG